MPEGRRSWILPVALFVVTFALVTLIQGPIFAATLLTILLAHESGHFFMCRKYGVRASFPIFIPAPTILGTMGAVIAMRSPIPSRKALFDIGVAGPLAGLVLAVPAIAIGLFFSELKPVSDDSMRVFLGEPLLFRWVSAKIVGPIPAGYDIFLHPVAFAGWAVLIITAINLFPVGQLDGGHLAYALFGRRARFISWVFVAVLVYLGIRYQPSWFIFAALILLIAWRHPPPLDDATPIDLPRKGIAFVVFVLFLLSFTPVPFELRF